MMNQRSDPKNMRKNSRNHKLKKGILIAVAVIVVAGIAWAKFSGSSGPDDAGAVFKVQRGNLRVSVSESGRVQASKSVALTCELEGQSTIIKIVPEGTYVKKGDELVVLDSANLRDRIDTQEITVKSAEAAHKNADEALQIQENQNDSDVKAAQLTVDFAKLDLDKYTAGESEEQLAQAAQLSLDFTNNLLSKYANEGWASQLGPIKAAATQDTGKSENPSSTDNQESSSDLAEMVLPKLAGGDWHQQLRNNLYDVVQADTNLRLAKDAVDGSRKLYEKKYVTETQLKADESKFQNAVISLKKAVEALRLLVNYDHPKQLAKFVADYEEAKKGLERAKRKADSQLAQRRADLDAKEATYARQQVVLDKLKDQLTKSTIIAPQPGLVVYSSSSGDRFRTDRGLIAEGEKVWQRQKLIELPDISSMKVTINVHESVRDMIKPDQDAIITIEALSGVMLHGHVEKVAILPDSANRWMNPDLTVYSTSIVIDDQSDALKPGMSAKVEIIIADLKNVLYVPVQAVTVRGEQEVCFVVKGSDRIVTPVEVGLSNDNYIEIKSGLKVGDKVLTYTPIALAHETPLQKPRDAKPKGAEGTESQKKETTPPDETSGPPAAQGETPRQLPPQMLERAKTLLQSLTAEQKKELGIDENADLEKMTPEQMRDLFRKMMPRRGGPGADAEGGRGGPRGQGRRPQGGPGGASGSAPRTRETQQPGNQ
jgi:HlyD family secretion protein